MTPYYGLAPRAPLRTSYYCFYCKGVMRKVREKPNSYKCASCGWVFTDESPSEEDELVNSKS